MTYKIEKIEKILKAWNIEYIVIHGGTDDYYFVAIHREQLVDELSSELLAVAIAEGWEAQYCPDPESHIEDGDVPESWEDNITVLNLL